MSMGSRFLFKFLLLSLVAPLAIAAEARAQQPTLVERVWYDGETPRRVWMATDEIAVVFDGRMPTRDAQNRFESATPDAMLIKQDGPVAYYKVPQRQAPGQEVAAARRDSGVHHASPVFYQNPGHARSAMALSGELVVSFRWDVSAQTLDQIAKRFGITFVQKLEYAPNTFVFDARGVSDSLDLANRIRASAEIAAAYPNWIRSFGRR